MPDVTAIILPEPMLKHPGHPDQKVHGRRGAHAQPNLQDGFGGFGSDEGIAAAFEMDLPNGYRSNVTRIVHSTWSDNIYVSGTFEEEAGQVGNWTRVLRPNDAEVHHEILEVDYAHQQQGIASTFIGETIGAYERAGYRKVTVEAAASGGYDGWEVWARPRFGFRFDDNNYDVIDKAREAVDIDDWRGYHPKAESVARAIATTDHTHWPSPAEVLEAMPELISGGWYGVREVGVHKAAEPDLFRVAVGPAPARDMEKRTYVRDARGRFAATAAGMVARGEQISIDREDLPHLLGAMAERKDHPNLTLVDVKGTALFNQGGRHEREDMPQVPSHRKGEFVDAMKARGVKVTRVDVNPLSLKPSQGEISGRSVGDIMRREQAGERRLTGDAARIVVSSDGYVLDGHHRWGAFAAMGIGGDARSIPAFRMDLPRDKALKVLRDWNDEADVQTLGHGEQARKSLWLNGSRALVLMEKHLSGQHDQQSHAGGRGLAAPQAFADAWIGGVGRGAQAGMQVEEIRTAFDIITTGPSALDSKWPPLDFDGKQAHDPDGVFEATRVMAVDVLPHARPAEETLYRGVVAPADHFTPGMEFTESIASWTPKGYVAHEFADGVYSQGMRRGDAVVLRARGLPSVPIATGHPDHIVRDADERIATGRYRVTAVTREGGRTVVDVEHLGLGYDPSRIGPIRSVNGAIVRSGRQSIPPLPGAGTRIMRHPGGASMALERMYRSGTISAPVYRAVLRRQLDLLISAGQVPAAYRDRALSRADDIVSGVIKAAGVDGRMSLAITPDPELLAMIAEEERVLEKRDYVRDQIGRFATTAHTGGRVYNTYTGHDDTPTGEALPAGWKRVDESDVRLAAESVLLDEGMNRSLARSTAQRMPLPTVYRSADNQVTIQIAHNAGIDEHHGKIVRQADFLQKVAPLESTVIRIDDKYVNTGSGAFLDDNVAGWTSMGSPGKAGHATIAIRPTVWTDRPRAQQIGVSFGGDYTMAHEWGHAVVQPKAMGSDKEKALYSMFSREGAQVSLYGMTKPDEFYAEMFADWHNTLGKTTRPVVRKAAKEFGWFMGDSA